MAENKSSDTEIKRYSLNLIISILLAIISYLFIAKIISIFYKPNISSILENNMMVLVPGLIHRCKPEPLEKCLFITGVFLIPLFVLIFYSMLKKMLLSKEEKFINNLFISTSLFTAAILFLFIFAVFNAPSVYVPPYSYLQLYILNSVLHSNLSFLVLGPVIIFFYFILRLNYLPKKKPFTVITMFLDISCLLLSVYMGIIFVCSIDIRSLRSLHFETVFYSMVQLFKGVPLGTDDFTNSYGLYPYFLNSIFKIIGLSVLKCSIIFCILISLSFLLIFFFLKNTVNNKFLVFLGFTSVVFLPTLSPLLFGVKLSNPVDPYYQYLPIRYIFPCLFLFVSSLYFKNNSKSYYYLLTILCPLSLLWNLDTGVVITLSWILLNIYSEFISKDMKTVFKNSVWHIIKIALVMMITITSFYLLVFIGYGRTPNLGLLTRTLTIFSKFGFGLEPMPLIHPWNILVLAYITGMAISIMALVDKNITPRTKYIFLVTIMGTGMLLYYQGRSHDFTLNAPSFYFFILLTLFLDNLLSLLKNYSNFFLEFFSILMTSILSLSVLFMSLNVDNMIFLFKESIRNIQVESPETIRIEKNCEFIRKHASPSEEIIILSGWSGIYFSRIPNISAFHPDITELYLQSDYERLERIIKESDVKIFAEEFNALIRVEGIVKTLAIVDGNGHMFLLKKYNHNDNRYSWTSKN